MKFMHISDLHIGKALVGISIYEDQKDILEKIVDHAREEAVDSIIIAGDVYDRAVPSGEALRLFDDFLTNLAELPQNPTIFIIYGNHDGIDRLTFFRGLLKRHNIHISPPYKGTVEPIRLNDEYGEVNVYLLPFVHPHHVEDYAEESFKTFQDAISYVVEKMNIDQSARNILVTHQYFADKGEADTSDSEINIRGGKEMIDVSVVEHFDYVALGHLHKPQYVGMNHVRYCGSPLKYSLSEVKNEKSVTIIELLEKEKGINRKIVPLKPLHDAVELKGTLKELVEKEQEEQKYQDTYVYIALTDEERVDNSDGILRNAFPFLLQTRYVNDFSRGGSTLNVVDGGKIMNPYEIFEELFAKQWQKDGEDGELNQDQSAYIKDLVDNLWRDV